MKRMNVIKMTEKEEQNLKNWNVWGKKMSLLKAIQRELAPARAERAKALKSIGL